jgi:hypothetical protein
MIAAAQERPSPLAADFDLHGVVGIRLIDASAAEIRAVSRQLGPIQAPLDRTPDITIRFVDRIPTRGPLCILGQHEAGFTDDAFFVLHHKHRSVRVKIPFDQIGGPCEILCERPLPAVPLLVPIINLTALAKGFLPLHAAAFRHRGEGVLVAGWSKGGKTETLLGFLAQGAEYIGDEWVYLDVARRRMFGIPEPMRLWECHLADLPQARQRLSARQKWRLRVLKSCASAIAWLAGDGKPLESIAPARKSLDLLRRQLHVDIAPHRLVGGRLGAMQGRVDRLLFVLSHDSPETVVRPIDSAEVAERMAASLAYEEGNFLAHYRMAQFVFPSLANRRIDEAPARRRELLSRMLADVPAHAVYHPYPAHIPSLVRVIDPLLNSVERRADSAPRANPLPQVAAGVTA